MNTRTSLEQRWQIHKQRGQAGKYKQRMQGRSKKITDNGKW